MNQSKEYFRYALLYEFQLGHTAIEAHRNLSVVFGEECLSIKQCYNRFKRFQQGDFSIEDEQRSGRPSEIDLDQVQALVKSDRRQSTREMASKLGCHHSTIAYHLAKLGLVQKFGAWVPHRLTDDQKEQRVSICNSLLSRHRRFDWLNNVVTGDEKWVLYANHTRKRQWLPREEKPEPEPKGELHPKKVMLSVFWDYKGILWYELRPSGTTVNSDVYCSQLDELAMEIQKNRPERKQILLLHDNARPHVSKETRRKINELGWEVLPHPPYSPDLAPSDYHLFRSLSNHLMNKKYDDFNHLKNDISSFFSKKTPDFYANGINDLPVRWTCVADAEGEYITD